MSAERTAQDGGASPEPDGQGGTTRRDEEKQRRQ